MVTTTPPSTAPNKNPWWLDVRGSLRCGRNTVRQECRYAWTWYLAEAIRHLNMGDPQEHKKEALRRLETA